MKIVNMGSTLRIFSDDLTDASRRLHTNAVWVV